MGEGAFGLLIIGIVVLVIFILRSGGTTNAVAKAAAATMNKKDEIAEKYKELRKGSVSDK
jgi:hypothetical protein